MKVVVALFSVLVLFVITSTNVNAFRGKPPAIDSVSIKGFEPTRDEVLVIKSRLPYFISESPEGRRGLLRDLSEYKYQFKILVDDTENRYVFINAVCKSYLGEIKSWDTELVLVKDGGNCFFSLEFEPRSGSFRNFFIHGEA
ncbi:MAG: hypothetical protein KAR06_00515 [Deltaproteobacteria bacterium]|nr:hypothetical protein [Deltaproteobacteria bacterium]